MVGHEYVGAESDAVACQEFLKMREVTSIVGVGEKTGSPIGSSLDNVGGNARKVHSPATWHNSTSV